MTQPALPKKGFRRSDTELNTAAIQKLHQASIKEETAVLDMMDSSKTGISPESAEERISQYGLNEIRYDKPPSWFVQLIKSFLNPFIFILLAIVIISYGIDVFFAAPGEKILKPSSS